MEVRIENLELDAIVLDFDGVLFFNFDGDYKDEYLSQHLIISFSMFQKFLKYNLDSVSNFILLTGRGEFQKDIVLNLLDRAGYKFNKTYFFQKERHEFPAYNKEISLQDFNEKYEKYKKEKIKDLNKEYMGSALFVDDNKAVIDYCKKKGFKHKHFELKKILNIFT